MSWIGHSSITSSLLWIVIKRGLHFLGIQIEVSEDGHLFSDLFCKPSSANMTLHTSSAHPRFLYPRSKVYHMGNIYALRETAQEQRISLFDRSNYVTVY